MEGGNLGVRSHHGRWQRPALLLLAGFVVSGCGRVGFDVVATGAADAAVDVDGSTSPMARTGVYIGDGSDDREIEIGFSPAFIIIKTNRQRAVIRTGTMTGDATKELSGESIDPNKIQAIVGDRIQVGSHLQVNYSGREHYWAAFPEQAGVMAIGSYIGDGSASRVVDGLGFQPGHVLLAAEDNNPVHQRSSAMPVGLSIGANGDVAAQQIRGFSSNGFEVGSDGNGDGVRHHFVAWAQNAVFAVGSYEGTGPAMERVVTAGFRPELVFVVSQEVGEGVFKTSSSGGSTDVTFPFSDLEDQPDHITALWEQGFSLGTAARVAEPGGSFYWMAWATE